MSRSRSNLVRMTGDGTRALFITLALFTCAVMMFGPAAQAQVTTGSLAGTITAQDGSALPGVTVEAVHVPTGTRYSAITNETGHFTIPNVRVGGPYTVTANLEGFKPKDAKNINVPLGSTADVNLALALAQVSESIEVTATADDIISPSHTGSTSSVTTAQIEQLPTVTRSLQDFARTNPYFNVDPQDSTSTRMTVAGRNNRYNTIQIDGAVNNDLFGLADTGTPGGQANTQPISLDAIQQLQLVVSPYDVRQGGFTGGGINAVTRSGTNKLSGSVYGTKRDQSFVGDGPFDKPVKDFDASQYGFRFGGPVLQDQLFYFVNAERNRRNEPTGVSADGSTGTVFRNAARAVELADFLRTHYNYDPGTLGDISGATDNDLVFGRLDWNAGAKHQLTLRHNYVSGSSDVIANRSASVFRFPTSIYTITDKTNSSVLQLNSVFGSNSFNEGRIGYQTIRDKRNVPVIFPTIEIGGTGPRRGELLAGTEQFSGANSLDQNVLELTDDYTMIHGAHTITVGTHNEFFKFNNVFLSNRYGYYYFPTLADFEAGKASEYDITFSNTSDPLAPAKFAVRQYGLYAGDQWRLTNNLSLNYGVRADKPDFVDTPSFNPLVESSIGYSTSSKPSGTTVISPRVGFNWDPSGMGKQQLRGGIGVFSGRTPYVWVSNAYANTGVETTALSATRNGPFDFVADPFNQPHNVGSAGTISVDLIDPDFKLPRVLRGTIGYDRDLFFGIKGTAEAVYTQTQEDVFYYNVNKKQSGTSPLDGRPTYTSVSTNLRDAILLSNSTKGHEVMESVQFNRRLMRGFTATAGYVHMDTETAMDATSSRAISNWQFRPTQGDIFKQDTFHSSFEVKDRFDVSATYDFATGIVNQRVGLFWNAQAGFPYSILMGGDPNKDGYTSNDLLFVPSNVILCPSSAKTPTADAPCGVNNGNPVAPLDSAQFYNFLNSAGIDSTGSILEANNVRAPWTHQLDFHYELGLPVRGIESQITFDMLNLMNLFGKDNGKVRYVNFNTYTPVNYVAMDPNGKPIYREAFSGALKPGSQYSVSDLRSRWQARVGLRFTF